MAGRSMHRGAFLAATLVMVAASSFVPGVASASGGGGCGGPVTDEAGTRVQIESYCFTPTASALQAAPVASSTRVQIDAGAWAFIALATFGLLLLVSGALVLERRRRRPVA